MVPLTERRSRLTGDLQPYSGGRVRFRYLGTRGEQRFTRLLSLLAALTSIGFFIWLVVNVLQGGNSTTQGNYSLLFAVIALGNELIRTPLSVTLALTAWTSKKPIPLIASPGKNVVVMTTFKPGSDDPERFERTLVAMKAIEGDGRTTILVCDEGLDGPEDESPIKALVNLVNIVHAGNEIVYYSRKGVERRNNPSGRYARRTKHGNQNAGLTFIRQNPDVFGVPDVVMGFDPDHVPHPLVRERMIGWFEDPDVAYVVGPQAYENATSSFIARLAESNQSPFHIQIQAAVNAAGGPMFVGTSWALRWTVLQQINGIQPSITEDLATTFAIISRKNPLTKRYWKSVYTPDVLAHGEGPDTFGAFYVQQTRWASGAIDYMLRGPFILSLLRMWRRPRVVLHYLLIMMFYPIMGLSWLLGAANIAVQTVFGANGEIVDPTQWTEFYGWVVGLSIILYVRMRRYNTSPFEKHSLGGAVGGLIMGVMTSPIYCHALLMTLIPKWLKRRFGIRDTFRTTPKGANSAGDRLFTFRLNLAWGGFYLAMIGAGFLTRHINPINLAWSIAALATLAGPIVIWRLVLLKRWAVALYERHVVVKTAGANKKPKRRRPINIAIHIDKK